MYLHQCQNHNHLLEHKEVFVFLDKDQLVVEGPVQIQFKGES